jgi:hypothetical protein
MQLRIVRNPRWGRSLVLGMVVACATLAATTSSALAFGDGDRDSYTANISPSSVASGSSTHFTVALTNTSSPGSGLSSALITPPLGYRVTGASLNGAPGHAYVLFNVVVLDRLSVPAGSTLNVSVTATAPSKCNSPYTRWFTWANEGGFWSEDLRLDTSGSSLTTTDPCDTATAVQFVNQPANALVSTSITNSSYNTSGSPVTVELIDSGGNVVNASGIPVTITLGNSRGATLGGTQTENTVNGVATFNDLKVALPNNQYTLSASSSGLPSVNSTAFDTSTGETDCNTSQDCMLTLTGSASTLNIDAGPNGGQLTGQVDPGTPMDGEGSDPTADPGCAGYTPQNPDWYGFDVTNLGDSGPPAKTVTWTVKNATPDGFKVCFGSTSSFVALNSDGRPSTSQGGTLPDGTQGFVGFLPFCDQFDSATAEPCITDDPLTTQEDGNSSTGVDVIVNVSIPANFAGDPWMGRG